MSAPSPGIMATRDLRGAAAAAPGCALSSTRRWVGVVAGCAAMLAVAAGCTGASAPPPAAPVSAAAGPGAGTPVTREPLKITAFIAEPCASLPAAQQEAIAVALTGQTRGDREISTCTWRFGADHRAELTVSWSHGTSGDIDVLAEEDPRPEWDSGRPVELVFGTLRALFPVTPGFSRSPNCNGYVQVAAGIVVSVAVAQFHASDSCSMVDTLIAAILAYVNPAR